MPVPSPVPTLVILMTRSTNFEFSTGTHVVRPGPSLITLVGAPLESVVVSAETLDDEGHHLKIGLTAPCIQATHVFSRSTFTLILLY